MGNVGSNVNHTMSECESNCITFTKDLIYMLDTCGMPLISELYPEVLNKVACSSMFTPTNFCGFILGEGAGVGVGGGEHLLQEATPTG